MEKRVISCFILLLMVYSHQAQVVIDSSQVSVVSDTLAQEKMLDSKDLMLGNDTLYFMNELNDSVSLKLHRDVDRLDSLWLNALVRSPLYDTINYVLDPDEFEVADLVELPTDLLKERLQHIDSQTPFNIAYNLELEQIIKTYLRRRKAAFSRLMEKARFYFPLFEEKLDAQLKE